MTFNEYQNAHPFNPETSRGRSGLRDMLPRITCNDGLSLSVQVGSHAYCSPRINDSPHYDAVEVGFPSEKIEEIMQWAETPENPTKTVYGYVPVEVVDQVIANHGGMKI